jgi:hypothetical protein
MSLYDQLINKLAEYFEPEPEIGPGSEYDRGRENMIGIKVNRPLITNENQGPYANHISNTARNLIGVDTVRPVKKGDILDIGGGKRKGLVCADSACDIFISSNLPWPKDKYGKMAGTIDYIEDAFEGRGMPGKLFKEHAKDFKKVKAEDLAAGDVLIFGSPTTQKHMVIVTQLFDNGFEAVHDQGVDNPKVSKFYHYDWVVGKHNDFHKAYRYSPSNNNKAFQNLMYAAD